MQVQEYFDFLAPDDIRIKGTRVGIESVLYEYVHRGLAPEAIAAYFPTLKLESVYATIQYYLSNRSELDKYLADWLEWSHQVRDEQARIRPPFASRLIALHEARWFPPFA